MVMNWVVMVGNFYWLGVSSLGALVGYINFVEGRIKIIYYDFMGRG